MRFPWERDVRRTCEECGETWDVPYLLRRQKVQSWRKASRSPVRPTRPTRPTRSRTVVDPWRKQHALHSGAAARAEAAEAERELIASLARCSACLSTDYTDSPIGK